MHHETEVLMILCDGCDMKMIRNMAAAKGFTLNFLRQSRNLVEKNFIFKIKKCLANNT